AGPLLRAPAPLSRNGRGNSGQAKRSETPSPWTGEGRGEGEENLNLNRRCGPSVEILVLPHLRAGERAARLQAVLGQGVVRSIVDRALGVGAASGLLPRTGCSAAATGELPAFVDEVVERLFSLEDDQRAVLGDAGLDAGARLRHVHEDVLLGLVVVGHAL